MNIIYKSKTKQCVSSQTGNIHGKDLLMRFAVLIIVMIQFLCVTNVLGNEVSLKVKDMPLEQVLKKISVETDYYIVFSQDDLKGITKKVTLNVSDASIEEVMKICLENTGLKFVLKDKTVIISKDKKPNPKQDSDFVEISGKVTDQEGYPLPGATILEKGTVNGVTTDEKGQFKFSVADKASVLLISYVGFEPKEVAINNQTVFNIVLAESTSLLGEVVVTGYQTISKERATGSFDKVKTVQIEAPASDISERLVGVVSGLQTLIDENGNMKFEIRGQTTLSEDEDAGKPLIVVDGFAVEGDFSTINPNDVESITVLKDAAAASIWGAKSANGVIVITTKRAKAGKTKVSVSSFIKFSSKLDLDYVNPWASSAEVIEYEQNAFDLDFFGGPWGPNSNSASSLDAQSQAITAMNEARLGRITESERDAILAKLSTQNNSAQIKEYLLQVPVTQQYNVNISGGNERMTHMLSLMYENSKDYFKENSLDKYLVNYNTIVNVTDWMQFSFSGMLQYNRDAYNGVSLSDISNLAPYDMLLDDDGSLADMSYLYYYLPNLNEYVPKDLFPYSDWSYNPITEIQNRDRVQTDINTRIQAGLKFNIIEGLTYDTKFQYELFDTKYREYYNEKTFFARQFVNETSKWSSSNPSAAPVQNVPSGGFLKQQSASVKAYNFRNQLNFDKLFGDKHLVSVIAGSELSGRDYEKVVNPDALGYDDEKLTSGELLNDINSARMWNGYPLSYARYFYEVSLKTTHTFSNAKDRYFSFYANGAYTYNDKYTLTASYRTDASNLITDDPKYRYAPFWSIGLGWQISKEDFMKEIDWLDRLNLRLTHGFNGNVDRTTSFKPLISLGSALNTYTEEYTASVYSYGNPSLRWEKTGSYDFGIDFSIWKGKLYGTIDLYHKKSKDLIISQSIPSINGTTSQKFNNGEMVNKGIEISLGTSLPIKGNDIVWDANLNFAYNKNEITKLFKVTYDNVDMWEIGTSSYVEGYNANTLWSLRYAGLLNVGTEADPVWTPSFYGENDEQLTLLAWPSGNAAVYESNEGTTVAPVTMGFSSSLKIYDFDFSFIITAKFGHVFRRQTFNYPAMTGGNTFVNDSYQEVITSDPSEIVPIPEQEYRYYFWDRFYPYMNYLTENASHIRFQEVRLTYSLPESILGKLGFSSLKLYVQANNLGTIKFNGYGEDPEYPKGTLKPQPVYTFGLKFNL